MNLRTLAAAGLLIAAPAAFAFEQSPFLFSPRPLVYTNFAAAPASEGARHYAALYGNEPELTDPKSGVPVFEGHIQIERPRSVQEFSVFFTKRLCRPLDAAIPAVSLCPARLVTYAPGGAEPNTIVFNNICVVHPDDAPPPASDIGRNGAHASVRTGAEPQLVLSALFNGVTLQQCTRSINLGSSQVSQ